MKREEQSVLLQVLGAGLILGAFVGVVCGVLLVRSSTNSEWEARLVDDPDHIAAIRSAVLAEREASARRAEAEDQ